MSEPTLNELHKHYAGALKIIADQRVRIELLEAQNKGLREGLLEYLIAIDQGHGHVPVTEAEKHLLKQTIASLQSIAELKAQQS